ncbi:conserved Plasmodium protein, unknown function [Plasmodium sp. gorilla clade G2]|uniref:conserved Plasmodium protein, unknown function n=1 Tax=Plasmodium sp. gorilla clade G2 TaxID=880535 RepID=UPI000D229E49|nr:conserved Plasmodium protein, unknown function [Plasmodium sp. gorilla clade G2]SOV14637.1 conserved Plasmodium protein, unknown function [Plasmodium sp. gorilla clade G2]
MAAFKPYRFIIFDQQIKNNQFYKSIITQLNLSLLCKEIYLNEAFSCYQYEKLFLKNLVYYSVNNLGNDFNARRLKCSGQSSVDPGENKLEQLINNENINVHINESKNVNNIYHNKCMDIPSDYHNSDESESMNHLNLMDDLEERHKNDPLYNLMMKNKNTKNKKLITQSDINNLVSFHIYDNKNKNTFKNILSLNNIYNIDHINILCLNNYKPILNMLKNYSINKRISIYYPFYIINDDKNNKSQNNLYTKVADYCYNIVSDILPLRYKNINLSDIIRAIIINTELCQSEVNKKMEVLKFVDIMDIIGRN